MPQLPLPETTHLAAIKAASAVAAMTTRQQPDLDLVQVPYQAHACSVRSANLKRHRERFKRHGDCSIPQQGVLPARSPTRPSTRHALLPPDQGPPFTPGAPQNVARQRIC